MDLQNVELVLFRKRSAELEESAEDPDVRKRTQRYAGWVFIASFISCFAVMMPLLMTLSTLLGLGLLGIMLITIPGCMLPLAFPLWRYELRAGAEREWMRRVAGPQARAFLETHWERRAMLREASSGFDASLNGLKLLPSGSDPEADTALAESMALRRDALEADAAKYLQEFEAATAADRARFASTDAKKVKIRDPRKAALRAFKKKIEQLAGLEQALDRLQSAADVGVTVDLSPFVAAQRFRRTLEEERKALVARGLKPKRLPPQRIGNRKLLPAAT
jgi:hypothetical protein